MSHEAIECMKFTNAKKSWSFWFILFVYFRTLILTFSLVFVSWLQLVPNNHIYHVTPFFINDEDWRWIFSFILWRRPSKLLLTIQSKAGFKRGVCKRRACYIQLVTFINLKSMSILLKLHFDIVRYRQYFLSKLIKHNWHPRLSF